MVCNLWSNLVRTYASKVAIFLKTCFGYRCFVEFNKFKIPIKIVELESHFMVVTMLPKLVVFVVHVNRQGFSIGMFRF
jgi:hypothetical protein